MTESESLASSIAIVGLAGRFPSARNVAEFWRNLVEGRDCITRLSDGQLAAAGYDPAKVRALPGYVAARGLIEKPEWFDAAFFGITPKEAQVIDPQQRLFLEIAWDALEDAGCDPARYAGLIGVFGGLTNNTYYQHFVRHRRDLLEAVGTTTAVLANEKDFLATRLAYKLDLRGPALNIQTACSSSLVATCTAVQSLLAYQCDAAIAGGVSITFPQERGYFYNEGAMTSSDGRCAPFDAAASGTVFSSGAGVVILKRLADALAEGDQIYAVIRGTALNNDGGKRVSFAAPSVDGHSEVIALAQAVAGVTPDTISYIETHGTGTPLGDPIEIAGLTQVFRAATDAKQTIPIGSAKGNIGHLDAASGVVGLIKTALALKHGQIPASLHCDTPNPALHLEDSPFFVNTELRPWPCGSTPRRAGVSSFGVGGTNAHVVLEEAPTQPATTATTEAQTLVLSAKTVTALDQRAADLAAYLEANPGTALADLAYTLQVGRQRFAHRRVIVARTAAEAIDALRKPTRLQRQDDRTDTHVAFLFPGQGTQYAQMGAQLHRQECAFRDALDEVAAALQPELGLDLRSLLFSTDEAATERLRETRITQPAIFAVDYAIGRLWLSLGIEPAALLGHSVGEFAAAALAGVFSVADAAKLVATRARLVNELPGGAMLAIRVGEAEARELLNDQLSLAAVNSPKLCVISGPFDAIAQLEATCEERKIAARRLATSHAFHSAMVESVVAPFAAAVAAVKLHPPTLPIVSSATGDWLTDAQATDPQYWAGHLRATVRFADGVGRLLDERGLTLLEAGPGQTLTQLARQHTARTARHEVVHTIAEGADEELALATAVGQLWLAGTAIDWARIHGSDTRRRISLPSYPFERQRYFADLPTGTPLPLATSVTDGEPPLEALPAITAPTSPETEAAPAVNATVEDAPAASMLDQVRAVITDLSGQDITGAPGDTGFLELGFDSLFLSQAAITLTRKFATKVTFRQLLREQSNLQALADFLEANGAQQTQRPATSAPATSASAPTAKSAAPAAHGPFRPVVRELSAALTEKQERWIAEFIERYVARTAKSKTHTQQYRRVLADPRAVAGFKQVWKEMIYPIVVERSAGTRLWDIDGNEWLDITLAFGAAMLGHQPPFAIEAMKRQMDIGMEIGPTSPLAGEVAQMLCERTGMERVTFCNTGSEAVTGALRVARTVSGKPLIVYFSGSYHGIDNEALGHRTNSDAAVPIAPGITPEALANTLIFDYGDPRALEQIAARAGDIAAVLVEPVQSRRPGFQPREFLHKLRTVTQQHGVALIFDEVVTGFRCHPGGAQAYFGVKADLATYGKIIGGGISVGVIAGRAEYMDAFDGGHWQFGDDSFPEAAVTFFAGTFVRHPMALAAVKAVLLYLDTQGPELQATLARRTDAMVARISEIFDGTPFSAKNFTSNWYIHIAPDFKYGPLFYALMRFRGIHVWEARPCFVSTEHSEADLDRMVEAIRGTVADLEEGGFFIRVKNDAPAGADTIPTTESQREMLLVCQHDATGSVAYNETWTLRLNGDFDLGAFRAAAQTVVGRHDALRATVTPSGERLVIAPTLNVEVPLTDLSSLPDAERETRFAALREAESSRVFDLQHGPLVCLQIVRLSQREHAFVFNAHHLTCDGWSCDVLLNELAAIYSACREGKPHGLPEPMQMRDYERWEVAMRGGREYAEDKAYWLDQFKTIPPELTLPGDRPYPRYRTYRGSAEEITLPSEWMAPLTKLGAEHGATFFTVLLAGFETLLFRLAGTTDLVVGVPSAGQNLVDGENLIGHCVNLLPLRTQFHSHTPFAELLAAVQTTVLEGFEHQRLTFGTLLQSLTMPRTLGRVPLVPVTFNLDPPLSHIAFAGLEYTFENNPRAAFQFDLGFNCDASDAGFRIVCQYNTDIFDAATMRRWMDHFREVLEAAAANPQQPLSDFLPQLGGGARPGGCEVDPLAIEAALRKQPAVKDAAVVLGTSADGNPEIVAHVVPGEIAPVMCWVSSPSAGGELFYDDVLYNVMAQDKSRHDLYRRAFAQTVRDKVVVDVGTGRDAILARFCIEAGAKKVYAIEILETPAKQARQLVEKLGLADRIIVICGRSQDVQLPELADLCISENVGHIAGAEGGDLMIIDSRRFLKPGGRIVPERCATKIAAVSMPDEFMEAPGFEALGAHYARMAWDSAGYKYDLRLGVMGTDRSFLLSDEATFEEIDFNQPPVPEYERELTLKINRSGRVDGFLLWIWLESVPGVSLESIDAQDAWLPIFLPAFETGVELIAGDVIHATASGKLAANQTNRDYRIHGYVQRQDGTRIEFDYDSPHYRQVYQHVPFYARLFKGDTIAVTTKQEGDAEHAIRRALKSLLPPGTPARVALHDTLPKSADGKLDRQSLSASAGGLNDGNNQPSAAIPSDALANIERSLLAARGVQECSVRQESPNEVVAYVVLAGRRAMTLWPASPSAGGALLYDDMLYNAMREDRWRHDLFQRALALTSKDRVVVDVGTGRDALLARFAVEAGAKKVYAIELLEQPARQAKELVAKLGLSDRITVIQGRSQDVQLPELAEVIVSENVGHIGGAEGGDLMLADAQRFLRPGGTVIPAHARTMIAAVTLPDAFLAAPAFDAIGAHYVQQAWNSTGYKHDLRVAIAGTDRTFLSSTEDVFEDIDFREPARPGFEREIRLKISRNARIDGFLLWLDIETAPTVRMIGIDRDDAWLPVFLPAFDGGVDLREGDEIQATVRGKLATNGFNRDYQIEGRLVRKAGGEQRFDFTSWHYKNVYRQNAFYQRLFANDAIPVADSQSASPDADLRELVRNTPAGQNLPVRIVVCDALPPAHVDTARLRAAEVTTERPFPADRGIHRIFEEQALRRPDALAIADGTVRVTYQELNERANRLARHLMRIGVSHGACVGIWAERSPEFLIGILGIAKAGAAYVPIDPSYPAERITQMLNATRTPLVLTRGTVTPALASSSSHLVAMESVNLSAGDPANLAESGAGDDLAYVMFTSGSTGSPKAVAIPHRAISRLVINTDYAQLTPDDVVAFASNVCFDAATFEIWGALLNGGTVVVTPHNVLLSPSALRAHYEKYGITATFLTTSLFNQLAAVDPGMFRGLRHLLVGGEASDPHAVRRVLEAGGPERLLNAYGPTETTTFAVCHLVKDASGPRIPIGRPIANTTAFILDSQLQPVPIGTPGELYLGGPGLALGYMDSPELTAARFPETPFGRLYRTGDLACWRPDGTIDCLGRNDDQVKVRGFRVEPGEIEAVLRRQPGVKDCRVIAVQRPSQPKQLVAYFIANGSKPNPADLEAALARVLPAFMIPAAFVPVAAFPLTPNGKLDVRALPSPDDAAAPERPTSPGPRNGTEREVATVWSELLGRDRIGVTEDFFLLGGHSLLAIRMIATLRERTGVELPMRRLFEAPTVEAIAEFITAARSPVRELPSLVPLQRGKPGERPFFLVPGGWGGEVEFFVYTHIIRHLGPELPIYGLKARGADGVHAPHATVEEMAADYLSEIRTQQPHGPYLLGGECVGGIVAYEMARQLEARGEKVDLLALLDTDVPTRSSYRQFVAHERTARWRNFWEVQVVQPARGHLEKLAPLSLSEKWRYIRERALRRGTSGGSGDTDMPDRKALGDYPKLLFSHRLQPYGGTVTLIIDEESHRADGNLGWHNVKTGGLDVHVLPGDHLSYIRSHARTAAAKLLELIARTRKEVRA